LHYRIDLIIDPLGMDWVMAVVDVTNQVTGSRRNEGPGGGMVMAYKHVVYDPRGKLPPGSRMYHGVAE
jgi:hypothetical protein